MKEETRHEIAKIKARILDKIAQQKQRLVELDKNIELAEELMEEVKAYFQEYKLSKQDSLAYKK